jgi:hypothetical protein
MPSLRSSIRVVAITVLLPRLGAAGTRPRRTVAVAVAVAVDVPTTDDEEAGWRGTALS